jgi:hypothetical protein
MALSLNRSLVECEPRLIVDCHIVNVVLFVVGFQPCCMVVSLVVWLFGCLIVVWIWIWI